MISLVSKYCRTTSRLFFWSKQKALCTVEEAQLCVTWIQAAKAFHSFHLLAVLLGETVKMVVDWLMLSFRSMVYSYWKPVYQSQCAAYKYAKESELCAWLPPLRRLPPHPGVPRCSWNGSCNFKYFFFLTGVNSVQVQRDFTWSKAHGKCAIVVNSALSKAVYLEPSQDRWTLLSWIRAS